MRIAGKKENLKLRLQQAVVARVQILSEEETQQPRNQMEGLHPASHWEELNHMYEPVDSQDEDEEFRAPKVPTGDYEQIKYNYLETFERPDFQAILMLQFLHLEVIQ